MSDIKNEDDNGASSLSKDGGCSSGNQVNEKKEVTNEEKTVNEKEVGGFMSEGATTGTDNRGNDDVTKLFNFFFRNS